MLEPRNSRPARLPTGHAPVLCVVVDTEEEFPWDHPFSRENTGTTTIAAQPLAHQRVFDRLGIVPTYVVDWPVATTATAYSVLRRMKNEGRCEIGAHLHPWVSPPHVEDVSAFNSFTGNLPPELEFEKLKRLTAAITENFGERPVVFKAGRYGLGRNTAQTLEQLGYLIDASVVPRTSFRPEGGPDFSDFGYHPYWFGPEHAPLLELPVTTGFCGFLRRYGPALYPKLASPLARTLRLGGIAARSGALERIRLSPEVSSASELIRLAATLVRANCQVLTLTYHSPSLVPGHTPYVRTTADLDRMLSAIAACCEYFRDELGGVFRSVTQVRDAMLAQPAPNTWNDR